MTDPPPPTGPPPGWYPDPHDDPNGSAGFRWWDGSRWSETTTAHHPDAGPQLAPVGEWASQTVRLVVDRAGHLFTLLVVLIVPAGLLNGLGVWYAFRNAVLISDVEAGTISFTNPGAGGLHYGVLAATAIVRLLASIVLIAAVVSHTVAAGRDEPETWSASLEASRPRLGRTIGVTLAIIVMLVGLYLVFALSLLAPLLILITFPGWLVGSIWLVTRLALAVPAAVLDPGDRRPLRTGWALSSSRFWALFGRLCLLAIIGLSAWLVSSVIALPFLAIAGGSDGPVAAEPGELRMGDNPALFALAQLFDALGSGTAIVVAAAGLTLLYRSLLTPDGAPERPQQPEPR